MVDLFITKGLSINYLVLNFIGYTYYSTYNIYGFLYNPQYNSGQIHTSDLLFAFHALFMVSVHIILVIYYPRESNKPRPVWMACAIMSIVAVAVYAIFDPIAENIIKLMGLMKVIISFIKYCPQVYLNFKRRSTYGWSLENVILDLSGGSLAFLQIFVDYLNSGTSDQFSSNLNFAKFLLGIVTVVFDIIFLFQHYILYTDRAKPDIYASSPGPIGHVSDLGGVADADDYKHQS